MMLTYYNNLMVCPGTMKRDVETILENGIERRLRGNNNHHNAASGPSPISRPLCLLSVILALAFIISPVVANTDLGPPSQLIGRDGAICPAGHFSADIADMPVPFTGVYKTTCCPIGAAHIAVPITTGVLCCLASENRCNLPPCNVSSCSGSAQIKYRDTDLIVCPGTKKRDLSTVQKSECDIAPENGNCNNAGSRSLPCPSISGLLAGVLLVLAIFTGSTDALEGFGRENEQRDVANTFIRCPSGTHVLATTTLQLKAGDPGWAGCCVDPPNHDGVFRPHLVIDPAIGYIKCCDRPGCTKDVVGATCIGTESNIPFGDGVLVCRRPVLPLPTYSSKAVDKRKGGHHSMTTTTKNAGSQATVAPAPLLLLAPALLALA